MNPTCFARCSLLALVASADLAAADVQVVFSRAAASPTSLVPGAVDEAGSPASLRFLSMLDFWLSPDGTRFLMRGSTDPTSNVDSYVVLGSGIAGNVVLQESQPFPGAVDAEVVDFVGNSVAYPFNASNSWAFTVRARGGSSGTFNKVLRFDAAGNGVLRFQGGNTPAIGDLYTGLVDVPANPAGDETIGNSTQSVHLLNDGRIGWRDDTVLNLHSSRRPIAAYDAIKYRQVNIDPVTNLDGSDTFNLSNIASTGTISVFLTSPDGTVAVLRGNLDSDRNGSTIPATDPVVVVVNDRVRIQVGQPIPGSDITPTATNQTFVAANNDWYARGADSSGAWAVRNGTVIARTGDSIGSDTWGGTFYTISGSSDGDSLIAGRSSNSDPAVDDVLVVNGQVILREGDGVPIDLDGDGTMETAFVGRSNNSLAAFQANNSAGIAPDGTVYVLASLRDAAGADLAPSGVPYALLRIAPETPPCRADFNGDGLVFPDDLSEFITCFFLQVQMPGFCPLADFNGDGLVFPDDLSEFITNFFLTVAAGGC